MTSQTRETLWLLALLPLVWALAVLYIRSLVP